MEAISKSTKAKRLLWWSLAFAASIPVFYILTSGPIILVYLQLDLQRVIPPSILERFYDPLHALYDSETIPGEIFKAYIDFWLPD